MARVTGIGGLFLRSHDPVARSEWVETHLLSGVAAHDWHQDAGQTVFSPFPMDSDYFPADRQFMLSLRVDGLDELTAELTADGTDVETRPEWNGSLGKFARIHDPDANPVKLWQPPA